MMPPTSKHDRATRRTDRHHGNEPAPLSLRLVT